MSSGTGQGDCDLSGLLFSQAHPAWARRWLPEDHLTALSEPSAETIQIPGQPFATRAPDLKRQIGAVPEGIGAPECFHTFFCAGVRASDFRILPPSWIT
jgi:hypothetical protein